MMPIAGSGQLPMSSPSFPGVRPPVLPRPLPGTPGYMPAPIMPRMVVPPGAAPLLKLVEVQDSRQ
ncbi:hypothetical protein U1Q18_034210 [Sarracenia purpurea var. burkii]